MVVLSASGVEPSNTSQFRNVNNNGNSNNNNANNNNGVVFGFGALRSVLITISESSSELITHKKK